jgi:Sel1 repeat-containing protein
MGPRLPKVSVTALLAFTLSASAIAQTARSAPSHDNAPTVIVSCDHTVQVLCVRLTLKNGVYSGAFDGTDPPVQSLFRVDEWDSNAVILEREDIGGPSTGLTARYSGKLHADATLSGTVTWTWPGHIGFPATGNWSGNVPRPAVAARVATMANPARAPAAASHGVAVAQYGLTKPNADGTVMVAVPRSIHECERPDNGMSSTECTTWTWSGSEYRDEGTAAGRAANREITIERLSPTSVLLSSVDWNGPTVGSAEMYRGNIKGAEVEDGVEMWVAGTFGVPGKWDATFSGRVLAPTDWRFHGTGFTLEGRWESTAVFGGRIEIRQLGTTIATQKLNKDDYYLGKTLFRGVVGPSPLEAKVEVARYLIVGGVPDRWEPEAFSMPDPDHFILQGEGTYQRTSRPRPGDLACSEDNPYHVTGPFAGWRASLAEKQRHDYKSALCWATISASAGTPDGEALLGAYYFAGIGGAKDVNKATMWTKKAASDQSIAGTLDLAFMYDHGVGVSKDAVQAEHWRKVATDLQAANDRENATESANTDTAEAGILLGANLLRDMFENNCIPPQTNSSIPYSVQDEGYRTCLRTLRER